MVGYFIKDAYSSVGSMKLKHQILMGDLYDYGICSVCFAMKFQTWYGIYLVYWELYRLVENKIVKFTDCSGMLWVSDDGDCYYCRCWILLNVCEIDRIWENLVGLI